MTQPAVAPTDGRAPDAIGPVVIDRRFNGPRRHANGGYAAGRFAALFGGAARVVLRAPVPLGRRIDMVPSGDGGALAVAGRRLIAEVSDLGGELLHHPPVRPTLADAELASANHPFFGVRHALSDCYVCSPTRRDGLGVVPGPLPGAPEYLSALFRVPGEAEVASEQVWAALDCTSYAAQAMRDVRLCLLGTMAARQLRPIRGGQVLAVVGWTKETRARTYRTGSALVNGDGVTVAVAESIWVAIRGRSK